MAASLLATAVGLGGVVAAASLTSIVTAEPSGASEVAPVADRPSPSPSPAARPSSPASSGVPRTTPADGTGTLPARELAPGAWSRPEPLPRSVPTRVSIPAIGVDAGVVQLGLGSDGTMATPDGPGPVGWYSGGPTPGEVGPAVLAAHLTWNGERGAFFSLGSLRRGDTVVVRRADGRRVTFVVRATAQYDRAHFPGAEVYGRTPGPELRLITCAGDYDATARRYADNAVVYADLAPPKA